MANRMNFNFGPTAPRKAVQGGSLRTGIFDPYNMGPPRKAVPGGSMRQDIVSTPTMRDALMQEVEAPKSVAEILSEPLGEMTPNLGRASSAASRQRQIADMLLQGAQQQDNTSIAGGLSQLGQAFLARRAGQKADTAEDKEREMASLLLQQAIGEGPESQAARGQLFADSPAALVAQSDAARRQKVEDARYTDERDYGRGRDASADAYRDMVFNTQTGQFERQQNFAEQSFETEQQRQARIDLEETRRFNKTFGLSEREVAVLENKANAEGAEINVDDESTFRREYNSITSGFRDVQASYGRIKATDATTPAGQLSLVYQYMKMLDPGSTVMQGEQASASNAAGIPDKTRNLYNSIIKGKPLSANQVTDFTNQADLLYERSLQDYDKARTTYEGLANLYGYAPARVVPDFATGRKEPAVGSDGVPSLLARPTPGTVPPIQIRDDDDFDALPSGVEYVGPDGIRRTKP